MKNRKKPEILMRNRVFVPALLLFILVVTISVALLLSAAFAAKIGSTGAIVLIVLFFASMAAALATTEVIPWHDLTWMHLRRPRVLGAVSSIVLVSFGAMYSLVPLLKSGPDSDETVQKMSKNLADSDRRVQNIGKGLSDKGLLGGKETLVEGKINGTWGQGDCVNTYRFDLDRAGGPTRKLTVHSIKSGPGVNSYEGVFIYKAASDQFGKDGFARSTLSTEEEKGFHPGYAVDFQFSTGGAKEKLYWSSKSSEQNDLTLIRCGES